MIEIYQKAEDFTGSVDDYVVLDHIQRAKGRLKVTSIRGEEVGIFIERGKLLQKGDVLHSRCNRFLAVQLAKEPIVTARADNWEDFSRACYHLGNRHVRVQIDKLWLRFVEDSVLIELMHQLGLQTALDVVEFEPEPGAYGKHAVGHRHSHPQEREHSHAHHE